jgi:hypothetical protein
MGRRPRLHLRCGSDGAAVAIPLDVAFSLRLVSVLRRQRAGLASAAAVMIGVKAMATMARVKNREPDNPVGPEMTRI